MHTILKIYVFYSKIKFLHTTGVVHIFQKKNRSESLMNIIKGFFYYF